jgi:sugar lactone lactonase YvrE
LVAGKVGGRGRADGIGLAARFGRPQGIASDGAGKLYIADSLNRNIRQVDIGTGAVTTVAGSNYGGTGVVRTVCSIDGVGMGARFTTPFDVIPGGDGNLYVSDIDAHVLRKIDIATGTVTTLAGSPNAPGVADGVGPTARFNGPGSLTTDGAGHLYVADTANYTIRDVDLATGSVTTLVGSSLAKGWCDEVGAAARFGALSGLASDRAGHLFVVDGYIRKVDLRTRAVTTEFGTDRLTPPGEGPPVRDFAPRGGIAFDGMGSLYVSGPQSVYRISIATGARTRLDPGQNVGATDLTTDGAGNVYLVDAPNPVDAKSQIFRFDTARGVAVPFAGSSNSLESVDGSGTDARLASPWGVTTDRAGNIYLSELASRTIRMIAAGTNVVTTLAGDRFYDGTNLVDGVGAGARFYQPVALVADEGGSTLYISDSAASFTIRKLSIATRTVTTLAGVLGEAGDADGVGSAARFGSVGALALDRHGNLFVTDNGETIRKIVVATGAVTTLVGSRATSESKDGVGTDARFAALFGMAGDGDNTLYVSDLDAIRKIDVPTATVTTPLSSGGGTCCGGNLALDGPGTLYFSRSGAIRKLDLATKAVAIVVGDPSRGEVLLGPLPGALGGVSGIGLLPDHDLVIAVYENAILKAHLF